MLKTQFLSFNVTKISPPADHPLQLKTLEKLKRMTHKDRPSVSISVTSPRPPRTIRSNCSGTIESILWISEKDSIRRP